MNWEETIRYIRTQPEYKQLVEWAYFEEDLALNVERFRQSEEYKETKKLIGRYVELTPGKKLLDIGSGNGITSVAFALDGISVDSVEPDPSKTIGAGAIRELKDHYSLEALNVYEGFAEELKFPAATYDIVYSRQCMHHAYDLGRFINECTRVLKPGGLLITIRDHVIYDEADKKWFLEHHPLQKFYGGENAFTAAEYAGAMRAAGLSIKQTLRHFDTPINYFPLTAEEKNAAEQKNNAFADTLVQKKLGALRHVGFIEKAAKKYVTGKLGVVYDEATVPGRMYSFLAQKTA